MAGNGPKPPPPSRVGLILLWIPLLILIYVIYNQGSSSREISYGQLREEITKDNIAEITISDHGYVTGRFKNPTIGTDLNFNSYVVPELISDLNKTLEEKKIKPNYKVQGGSLGEIILGWLPILFFIFLFIFVMRRMGGMGKGMNPLQYGKSKIKIKQGEHKITFKDVAGIQEAKGELEEIVEFLKNPTKFTKLGGHIPKGVLLVGAPGTGKTLLAKAVAGEANVPFFSTSGSEFVEMFVGVGASRVRDMFEQGKKNAPCIIFIDEIDGVGGSRGNTPGRSSGNDEREQTLNQILSEMDGFEANEGVIILAATNRPDTLDPALLRPGRFDRRVVVDRPDLKGRLEILKVHSHKVLLNNVEDLKITARGTPGFVGADLANLLNEAALRAASLNKNVVYLDDLEYAKDKVLMGSERRSLFISEEEKKTTAYHEAGHAVLAACLPHADPIHKVTIIPRGMSLGSTWQLPDDDKHNYSKNQLETQLTILMGGRAAESISLSQCTTGASNDIGRASSLARRMVCEWGMSNLGPINFGDRIPESFISRHLAEESRNYSEKTAQEIDAEIKKIIHGAYDLALTVLKSEQNKVEQIAKLLIEKESLDGEEVMKIVKEP